jgi:hypothetical protein
LPVREARALGALEDSVDDRAHASIVELLIRDSLVKGLIEQEIVFLHVPSQVDFEFRLPDHNGGIPAENDVLLLRLLLASIHRPLPHDNGEPPSAATPTVWGLSATHT